MTVSAATVRLAKDHFALISALVIVASVLLATVFLFGYLNVFDWRLFWVVQYPDILTFALIAVALLGASATTVPQVVEIMLYSGVVKGTPKWGLMAVVAVVLVFFLGLNLVSEYRSADPHYQHIISLWLFIGTSLSQAFLVTRMFHLGAWPDLRALGWATANAVLTAYLFGMWLGFAMLESKTNDQDIVLKNGTLNQAKLVMMMSHHTILYKDGVLYVVPTADVVQVTSPRHLPNQ